MEPRNRSSKWGSKKFLWWSDPYTGPAAQFLFPAIGQTAALLLAVNDVGDACSRCLVSLQYWLHASREESNEWATRLPFPRHRILQLPAELIGPDPQDAPVQKFAMRILGAPKRSPGGVIEDFRPVVDLLENVQRAGRPRGLRRKQLYLSRQLGRQIAYTTPAPPVRKVASADGTKPAKSDDDFFERRPGLVRHHHIGRKRRQYCSTMLRSEPLAARHGFSSADAAARPHCPLRAARCRAARAGSARQRGRR